ncbi:hypothetical protein PENSPDRAFT_687252 [Peniophora sp. CONT]|nr:hypothetical protein PENSPDRAFT_687252 [Peniophora sp. CONT]
MAASPQHQSLLSLSLAAASVSPIEINTPPHSSLNQHRAQSVSYDSDDSSVHPGSLGHKTLERGPAIQNGLKTRRLSSTSQTRKRFSDAREAAARPSSVTSSAAAALAGLSLSPGSASGGMDSPLSSSVPDSEVIGEEGGKKKGKKGMLFTCESCSKVYRHPSCLIKHRWEHTPQWREASKLMLSKHQQVQLMEAAAILSNLSPASTGGQSLPEDRSLWPSFLSGGALPGAKPIPAPRSSSYAGKMGRSASGGSGGSGPRLHEFGVASGVTRLRPGVVAVSTSGDSNGAPSRVMSPYADEDTTMDTRRSVEPVPVRVMSPYADEVEASPSVAVPVPAAASGSHRYPPRYGSAGDEPWSTSLASSSIASSFARHASHTPSSLAYSFARTPSDEDGIGEEGEGEYVDVEHEHQEAVKKEEEEEWDGMDMEMEM